jgi:two-component system nitrate/nitrite response regulator NarL
LIRVWIETSSTVARAGFEALLAGSAGIELADSAHRADVILCDELPEGPDASAPLVVLSDEPITALALRWGVRGMLPRHASTDQITAALHAVAAGLIAVPAQAGSFVIPAAETEGEVEALTPRELEAFEMLAEGFSNKQIAAKLQVSEHTAKFHVNSILGKMRAGTRTEAVVRGLRKGILKV